MCASKEANTKDKFDKLRQTGNIKAKPVTQKRKASEAQPNKDDIHHWQQCAKCQPNAPTHESKTRDSKPAKERNLQPIFVSFPPSQKMDCSALFL